MISRGKWGKRMSMEAGKGGRFSSKERIRVEGKEAEGRGSRRKCEGILCSQEQIQRTSCSERSSSKMQ